MKKYFLLLLSLLFLTFTVFAQKPTPTPPANDDDVVKISTTLIQIDVTVTDKNGKIVTDLKAEDFEVYENGKKQDITNFLFVTSPALKRNPFRLPKIKSKKMIKRQCPFRPLS